VPIEEEEEEEEEYSHIKFHENPSTGNRFFPCGQKDG
jgi:hypothetical protein